MARKNFPTDLLAQANSMQDAWARIDEQMTFGTLNIGAFVMDINNLRNVELNLAGLENQLTELRNQREALQQATWDKMKRMRAGVKASFGDDSAQYELVGGTRLSDKKPARRTAAPAP